MNAAAVESSATVRWLPAYVGVGSNLDDPAAQVRRAFDALARIAGAQLIARSPLYRTRPLGEVVQPAFVNAVAALLTRKTPEEFLAQLRALEVELGREPVRERWGPRRIDLDLLVLGQETSATENLKLPHPGIGERDFVLFPLADLAPDLDIPGRGRVATLKAAVTDRGIEKL